VAVKYIYIVFQYLVSQQSAVFLVPWPVSQLYTQFINVYIRYMMQRKQGKWPWNCSSLGWGKARHGNFISNKYRAKLCL